MSVSKEDKAKAIAEQEDRFWALVAPTGFCWEWTGALTHQGYGQFSAGRSVTLRAHRVSYALLVAPLPSTVPLDHLCRNRACVNPDHLAPTTIGANVLAGFGISAENARKTHCKHGHEFTPENTIIRHPTNQRRCRTCTNERARGKVRVRPPRTSLRADGTRR